jgi:hypothetical protein
MEKQKLAIDKFEEEHGLTNNPTHPPAPKRAQPTRQKKKVANVRVIEPEPESEPEPEPRSSAVVKKKAPPRTIPAPPVAKAPVPPKTPARPRNPTPGPSRSKRIEREPEPVSEPEEDVEPVVPGKAKGKGKAVSKPVTSDIKVVEPVCLACQKAKTECIPNETARGACVRCNRMKIGCSLREKKSKSNPNPDPVSDPTPKLVGKASTTTKVARKKPISPSIVPDDSDEEESLEVERSGWKPSTFASLDENGTFILSILSLIY